MDELTNQAFEYSDFRGVMQRQNLNKSIELPSIDPNTRFKETRSNLLAGTGNMQMQRNVGNKSSFAKGKGISTLF